MPAAARVLPAGATAGAQASTLCTGLAKVRRAIGVTAAAAMAVSVRIAVPADRAARPASQAPVLKRSRGASAGSPLLCTSRSSTSCSTPRKPVSPNQAWMRRRLSVKIGWSKPATAPGLRSASLSFPLSSPAPAAPSGRAAPMPIHLYWGDDEAARQRAVEALMTELVDPAWRFINLSRLDGNDSAPGRPGPGGGPHPALRQRRAAGGAAAQPLHQPVPGGAGRPDGGLPGAGARRPATCCW